MPKCMTIADEAIDQKETCTEITPKDVVEFILEEAFISVFIASDKGCSRIGDFNITDDFRQQEQFPHPKDFEQVDNSEATENIEDSSLKSGENVEHPARENLESLKDSLVKKGGEKLKLATEYTVVTEEILADNELQIQNGQIHIEKNKSDENSGERSNFFNKEDVVKDEKIEIEYFNGGKLNKIYVPLNPSDGPDLGCTSGLESKEKEIEDEGKDQQEKVTSEEDPERPFKPFTTEELRQSTLQVWGNGNSSLVGKWDGDVLAQEEAVRLMEELSSVQVFPDSSADPNRPRACAFAEEDVKKMIREIEEISFTQCHTNPEDADTGYHADGQGDADLESKSCTISKDNMVEPQKNQKPQEEVIPESKSNEDTQKTKETSNESKPESLEAGNIQENKNSENASSTQPKENLPGEGQYDDRYQESQLQSSFYTQSYTKIEESLNPDSSCPGNVSEVGDSSYFTSLLTPEKSPEAKGSGMFLLSDNYNKDYLKDYHNMGVYDDFFPETRSSSGNIGSLSGSKLDEFTIRNTECASELDTRAFQSKRSDMTRASRSVNDTQENASDLINQGTISLGRLTSAGSDSFKRLDPDSFFSEEKDIRLISMETDLFVKKSEETRKSQDAGNFLQGSKHSVEVAKHEEDSATIWDVGQKQEETVDYVEERQRKYGENGGSEGMIMEAEGQLLQAEEDTNATLVQSLGSHSESKKSITNPGEESNVSDVDQEGLPSPQTPSQVELSNESQDENKETGTSDVPSPGPQTFKLQSQRMYLGANYEPVGPASEFNLTESEEAFIDMTESVIQIIDPQENNVEEDSEKISFTLLSEVPNLKPVPRNQHRGSEIPLEKTDSSDVENLPKAVYSGMTTIGPIKNMEHDPKDLTAPEIDFGMMTRITSSRQLANDIGLFNPEITAIKIVEEDDMDDAGSLNIEDSMEPTSLVNRDIASLTKVQKIREVMSYHPKSEEEFEDEEVLARPRLDLKDVESMTDERYKVPDVSIPLLSFEVGESDLNVEKELMESMSLVISGLTNPTYYEEDIDEDSAEIPRNAYEEQKKSAETPEGKLPSKKSWKTLLGGDKSSEKGSKSSLGQGTKDSDDNLRVLNAEHEGGSNHQKYGTLGSVFRKASSKLIRKEDVLARMSKSLPRDASRVSTTDSIRSMLDDCQSSASVILKKSRSLLKNTQNVFKSISQGRMSPESGESRVMDQKKSFSPSESDVSTVEKRFSGFLKKEDFTKAKNLIMGKVEKAFKGSDAGNVVSNDSEGSSEKKELRVAIRNTENLQVDRMENFKKLLPKTPLVYKSQFVKSQMNVKDNPSEIIDIVSAEEEDEKQKNSENEPVLEDNSINIPSEETEISETQEEPISEVQIPFQEKLQWINSQENVKTSEDEDTEPQQPDFIIMETVQGLPAESDLESPSSEKENINIDNIGKIQTEKGGNDLKKTEASNSLETFSGGGHDVAPCFEDPDEEKAVTKPPLERKIKAKKKFTARFRSFWSSAFGRVKTPREKGDLS